MPYSDEDKDILSQALAQPMSSPNTAVSAAPPAAPPPPLTPDQQRLAIQRNQNLSPTQRLLQMQAVQGASVGAPPPTANEQLADALRGGRITESGYDKMRGRSPQEIEHFLHNADTYHANRAPSAAAAPDMSQVVTAPQAGGGGSATPAGPAAPPVQTIPEHWTNILDPHDREVLNAGREEQLAGLGAQERVATQAGQEQYETKENALFERRAAHLLDERESERDRKALERHQEELEARGNKLAERRIDPNRYKGSGGRRLMLGIAAGLGAAGAALSHGQNSALAEIQQGMEEDIKAQEHDIENEKGGLENAKGLLADKWRLFGDKEKAKAAARQEMLQDAAMESDAIAAKYAGPQTEANNRVLRGQLLQQMAIEGAKLNPYTPAKTVGGGGYGLSDVKPDEVLMTGDGRHVTVPEKDREKVVAAINQSNTVHEAANQVRSLLQVPLTSRGIAWAKAYDSAQEVMAKAELSGGGRGGKGLIEMNARAGGGRTLTWTPGVDRAVRELESGAASTAHSAIESSAQYEVTPQLYRNPKTGTVERKYTIDREYQRGKKPEGDVRAPEGVNVGSFRPVGGT